MKNNDKIKCVKTKAAVFLRSGFALFIVLVLITIFTGTALAYVKRAKVNERKVRNSMYKMMEIDMAKCAQIGVRMQYAGADFENELLPILKRHLYSLSRLNEACEDAFGIIYTPVSGHFINRIQTAVEIVERDLSAGYSTEKSECALCVCLTELGDILKAWDFDGA